MASINARLPRARPTVGSLAISLSLLACGEARDGGTGPAIPDGAVDNGDGTTTITLGGTRFTTVHRDFSGEPVVTTPTTLSATLRDTFDLLLPVERFRVVDGRLIGFRRVERLETHLVVYDLANKDVLSAGPPGVSTVGFDYNGAIVTVEGARSMHFYLVGESGALGPSFFTIPEVDSTGLVSDVLLDEATVYVYVGHELRAFPVYDPGDVTAFFPGPPISDVRFTADETRLYVSVATHPGSSYLTIFHKSNLWEDRTIGMSGRFAVGVSVDANYLYVADGSGDEVLVWNKHTDAFVGAIAVPDVGAIEVVGRTIYAASRNDGIVRAYELTYADVAP